MSLRIWVHDVGHGQAVHAFMPSDDVVVVDLGRSDSFSPLEWLHMKASRIDSLVITHPHGDHIDEILDLDNKDFDVRQLWRPKWLTENEIRESNQVTYKAKTDCYLEMSKRYSHPVPYNRKVGNPAVTGGVRITQHASTGCGRSNINNHSGVVVFEYLGLKVVIPGDNESPSWRELLENTDFLEAARNPDVFMASHHGRESGYYAHLFDDTHGIGKPRLCVVSDGRVQDTDAADRYSYHARGWRVNSRSDNLSDERSCVTTRADGPIEITIGKDTSNGKTSLSVTKA